MNLVTPSAENDCGLLRRAQVRGFTLAAVALACAFVPGSAVAHTAFPIDADPNTRDGHYQFGAYPPADASPRWWFESRFPGRRDSGSRYKDRVRAGAQRWNNANGQFKFISAGYRELPYFVDPYYAPDTPDQTVEDIRSDSGPRSRYCDSFSHDKPETPDVYDPVPASLVFWPELPPANPGEAPPLGEATTCNRVPVGGGDARPFKFFVAINRLYSTCDPITQPLDTCKGSQWYKGADPDRIPLRRYDLQSVATHEFGHATGLYWHFNDPGLNTGDEICRAGLDRDTLCQGLSRGSADERSLGTHDLHTFRGDATQAGAYPAE